MTIHTNPGRPGRVPKELAHLVLQPPEFSEEAIRIEAGEDTFEHGNHLGQTARK